uniref:Uncharacterized protein n=1 Tax=Oryza barthii TaxID=65489 RepID=A0A0D3F2Y5_9ORYZ
MSRLSQAGPIIAFTDQHKSFLNTLSSLVCTREEFPELFLDIDYPHPHISTQVSYAHFVLTRVHPIRISRSVMSSFSWI